MNLTRPDLHSDGKYHTVLIKTEKIQIEHHSERMERHMIYSMMFTENLEKVVLL